MLILRLSLLLLISVQLSNCSKGNNDLFQHMGSEQWTVINYWATWCKPCIEEIPELNQLAASQTNHITVLGVDFDQSQDDALQAKIDKLGIHFTVLNQDPAEQLGYPRPTVLPTTIIINPQQQLHQTLVGPQTQQSLLQAIETQPKPNSK